MNEEHILKDKKRERDRSQSTLILQDLEANINLFPSLATIPVSRPCSPSAEALTAAAAGNGRHLPAPPGSAARLASPHAAPPGGSGPLRQGCRAAVEAG